jgi:hypothetical protein
MCNYREFMGKNPYSKYILEVVNLMEEGIEGFLDCGIDYRGEYVWVLCESFNYSTERLMRTDGYVDMKLDDYGFIHYRFRFPSKNEKKMMIVNRLREFVFGMGLPDIGLINKNIDKIMGWFEKDIVCDGIEVNLIDEVENTNNKII